MTKWLSKLFPSLAGRTFKPTLAEDDTPWTEADAAQLKSFLQSRSGRNLLLRMKQTVTTMCLSPEELDEATRHDRRAIAWVIEGIESMADEPFWAQRDREAKAREQSLSWLIPNDSE